MLLLALATISNFPKSGSVGDFQFFKETGILLPSLLWYLMVEASKEKKTKTNLLAADNSAEEDQIGPTEAAKLQLTHSGSVA